jgi:hypothetical protein
VGNVIGGQCPLEGNVTADRLLVKSDASCAPGKFSKPPGIYALARDLKMPS